ncbi:MAG: bacterial proteasome activator family protein [Actinomycetota bacterium]
MVENEKPKIVLVGPDEGQSDEDRPSDEVHHPAKVMRIASMVRNLLDEVRSAPLDDASRVRVREVYETSVKELGEVLSEDLREELSRLSLPFDEANPPSDAELRVAHAQLVGWLEGLFHGIQAMLFAQQMEGRQRFEELRKRGLPAGGPPGAPEGTPGSDGGHGQYL